MLQLSASSSNPSRASAGKSAPSILPSVVQTAKKTPPAPVAPRPEPQKAPLDFADSTDAPVGEQSPCSPGSASKLFGSLDPEKLRAKIPTNVTELVKLAQADRPKVEEDRKLTKREELDLMFTSPRFNFGIALIICLNTLLMGVELDMKQEANANDSMLSYVEYPRVPEWVMNGAEATFSVIFALEFVLRVYTYGLKLFKDWSTWIDLAAVLPSLISIMMQQRDDFAKNLVAIRIMRLLKLCRLLRLIKMCKELMVLVMSFVSACRTLLWVAVLLFIVLYCASVFCTILIGQNALFGPDNPTMVAYQEEFGLSFQRDRYFGSIMRSTFTLFQIFTLDNWSNLVRPVVETHQPWMFLFFIMFIFVTTFGLLNLLVGVIVDCTVNAAKQSDEERERLLQEGTMQVSLAAEKLFSLVDVDGNQTISPTELTDFLQASDHADQLRGGLPFALDLDEFAEICQVIADDWLDPSNPCAEGLTLPEFVGAAVRLQGVAQSRDVVASRITMKSLLNRVDRMQDDYQFQLKDLHAKIDFLISSTGTAGSETGRPKHEFRRSAELTTQSVPALPRMNTKGSSGSVEEGYSPHTDCKSEASAGISSASQGTPLGGSRRSLLTSSLTGNLASRGAERLEKVHQLTKANSTSSMGSKLLARRGKSMGEVSTSGCASPTHLRSPREPKSPEQDFSKSSSVPNTKASSRWSDSLVEFGRRMSGDAKPKKKASSHQEDMKRVQNAIQRVSLQRQDSHTSNRSKESALSSVVTVEPREDEETPMSQKTGGQEAQPQSPHVEVDLDSPRVVEDETSTKQQTKPPLSVSDFKKLPVEWTEGVASHEPDKGEAAVGSQISDTAEIDASLRNTESNSPAFGSTNEPAVLPIAKRNSPEFGSTDVAKDSEQKPLSPKFQQAGGVASGPTAEPGNWVSPSSRMDQGVSLLAQESELSLQRGWPAEASRNAVDEPAVPANSSSQQDSIESNVWESPSKMQEASLESTTEQSAGDREAPMSSTELANLPGAVMPVTQEISFEPSILPGAANHEPSGSMESGNGQQVEQTPAKFGDRAADAGVPATHAGAGNGEQVISSDSVLKEVLPSSPPVSPSNAISALAQPQPAADSLQGAQSAALAQARPVPQPLTAAIDDMEPGRFEGHEFTASTMPAFHSAESTMPAFHSAGSTRTSTFPEQSSLPPSAAADSPAMNSLHQAHGIMNSLHQAHEWKEYSPRSMAASSMVNPSVAESYPQHQAFADEQDLNATSQGASSSAGPYQYQNRPQSAGAMYGHGYVAFSPRLAHPAHPAQYEQYRRAMLYQQMAGAQMPQMYADDPSHAMAYYQGAAASGRRVVPAHQALSATMPGWSATPRAQPVDPRLYTRAMTHGVMDPGSVGDQRFATTYPFGGSAVSLAREALSDELS